MASFPLKEQPLRTQLKICTEADYLQAHLTVIEGESRRRDPAFHNVKQRVTSILKKWILAANANLTTHSNPLLRLRAISTSQQFWAGFRFGRKALRNAHQRGGTSRRGKQS
jgi:hypothetical protein